MCIRDRCEKRNQRVEERGCTRSGLGRRAVLVQGRASCGHVVRTWSALRDDDERRRRRSRLAVLRLAAGEHDERDDRGHDQDRDDPAERSVHAGALPQIGSRTTGQVMQCPPPRPLPSSKPSIVTTSTPASRIFEIVNVLRSYATTTPGSSATTLLPSSHCSRCCW